MRIIQKSLQTIHSYIFYILFLGVNFFIFLKVLLNYRFGCWISHHPPTTIQTNLWIFSKSTLHFPFQSLNLGFLRKTQMPYSFKISSPLFLSTLDCTIGPTKRSCKLWFHFRIHNTFTNSNLLSILFLL